MRFWNEAKDDLYLIQLVWPWREGGVRTEDLLMSSWVFSLSLSVLNLKLLVSYFPFFTLTFLFFQPQCRFISDWRLSIRSFSAHVQLNDSTTVTVLSSFSCFSRNLFWTMKYILLGFSVINLKQLKVSVSKEVNTQMNSNSNSSQFVATVSVVIFQNSAILSRAHSRPISPWSRRRSQKSFSLFTFSFLFVFPC